MGLIVLHITCRNNAVGPNLCWSLFRCSIDREHASKSVHVSVFDHDVADV